MGNINVMICLNHLSYRAGGVSTHILDLCKEYDKMDDIENVVVASEWGEHIDVLESIKKVKYFKTSFWTDGMTPRGIYHSYKQLRDLVEQENIDIVHAHSQRLIFAIHLLKIKTGIPYIWTNHIDDIPQRKLFKLMCRVMRFPVISVSRELRRMMIEEFKCAPGGVFVVNNGIDFDELCPLSEQEKMILHERYHIDRTKTPIVICQLSRISPIKGQLKLLQAINALHEKNSIKVLIAGSVDDQYQDYYHSLEAFRNEHGLDVEFLGFSKPKDVFGIADLLVVPSIYEGFSLVSIESLAMGCAVIRTKTPGWHEMQDWVTCISKNDQEALVIAIQDTMKNNFNKEKTLAGQEMVRKLFSKERCASETVEVYKELIKVKNA